MVMRFFVSLFLLLTCTLLNALTASVEKTTYYRDETIVLTIESNDGNPSLDFSVFAKHFEVVGRSSSSRVIINNGDITSQNTVRVSLLARQTGALLISSITDRNTGKTTKPIAIEVLPDSMRSQSNQFAPNSINNGQAPKKSIFFEVKALPDDVFVGQTVLYRIDFYVSADQETSINNEVIESSDDFEAVLFERKKFDQHVRVGGHLHYRLRYDYFLTPKRAGSLVLPRVQVDGSYVHAQQGVFGRLGRRIPFTVISPRSVMDVKAVPVDEQLLVSSGLILKEQWSGSDTLRLGDSVQRKITIEAYDVLDIRLPEVGYLYPKDIKVYPQEPTLSMVLDDEKVFSRRIQTEDLVPLYPGQYVLGAFELKWWNTASQAVEISTIPTRVFEVLGEISNISTPSNLNGPTTTDVEPEVLSDPIKPKWLWLGSFVLLLLLCCYGVWRRIQSRRNNTIVLLNRCRRKALALLSRGAYLQFKETLAECLWLMSGKRKKYHTLYEMQTAFAPQLAKFFDVLERATYGAGSLEPALVRKFKDVFNAGCKAYIKSYKQEALKLSIFQADKTVASYFNNPES